MSNSLWSHARILYPPLSPRICSDSCWWCYLTISSFATPSPGSFPMSQLFASGHQSTEASALTSVLPMNIQGWFTLGLTGLISMRPSGLSEVFSSNTVQKHQFFSAQPSLWSNSHIHTCWKNCDFYYMDLLPTKWCLCFLICWLGVS